MIEWALGYWANQYIAFGLYWLPLAVCAIGYTIRSAQDIQNDKRSRDKTMKDGRPNFYLPTITIGTLIGRGLVSVIPVANLCAAIFSVAPEFLGSFFTWIGNAFNQPLVPERKGYHD